MIDEQKCITAILDGDTERYRDLVTRYQTGLIIHCENILKDRQDAEDIAQETFIKAFQKLKNFSSEKARFSTWIYRIATNLCIDRLRKEKRKVLVNDIDAYVEAVDPDHMNDEEVRHIRELVETLEPPKYVEIIKAYFWQGESYQTIADRYSTSTNTVGTWIRRAKAQLKEQLS